jgi:FtsZ-binding cell division protein ZapB
MNKMEEQKKKSLWSWIKENRVAVGVGLLSLTLMGLEGYYLLRANKCIGNLKKDNQTLKGENADLRGQIHATEKENRRLSHELNNTYYQLGKEKASNEQKEM